MDAPRNPDCRRSVVGLVLLLLIGADVAYGRVLQTASGSNDVSCGVSEFKCADGERCVPFARRCDGNGDCGDASDERNCTKTETKATPGEQRCILVIGGLDDKQNPPNELVEYYHPTMDECDKDAIGMMSTENINITRDTSGCYLSDTQQIVIREGHYPERPSMLYGLKDSSAKQLPLPDNTYATFTTAASISPTKCLSCGDGYYGYEFDSSSPTEWTPIDNLPFLLNTDSASVSMVNNNSYYVIGTGSSSNEVFRYSVSERQWYTETPMNNTRYSHSAAALSTTEFIVCGGAFERKDCEVYSTTEKKWRPVANLNRGRHNFAMHNFNGIVYAIGGQGEHEILKFVEAYNVQTNKWTFVKNLKFRRHRFVSVVVV